MITIGFSTRKIDESFIELLKKSCGLPKVEVIPLENNGEYSLTEAYNIILSKSSNDVVVLCHDDIYFDTKNWGTKLLNHFKRNEGFGILGVAGSTYLHEGGKWWEDFTKVKGIVNHDSGGKKWESKYSISQGNQLDEVLLIDGLFMALSKKRIKLNFNEEVKGFHFYDVDFSFSNYLEGVRIGVMYDIRITHKSVGQTNDEWEINKQIFANRYKEVLPKKVPVKIEGNKNFKVMVTENFFSKSPEIINFLLSQNFQVFFLGHHVPSNDIKKLKNKNVKFYDFLEPYGFKLGDGVWGFNSPQGVQLTEKGKKYKVKDFDIDIIHNLDDTLTDVLQGMYPNAKICNLPIESIDYDDVINKYNEILNG